MTVPFIPAHDPLGHTAILAHQANFPVLGLSLAVRSNSLAVVKAAWNSFGHWLELDEEFIVPSTPLDVAMIVHGVDNSAHPPGPFIFRVYGDCLLAASRRRISLLPNGTGDGLWALSPRSWSPKKRFSGIMYWNAWRWPWPAGMTALRSMPRQCLAMAAPCCSSVGAWRANRPSVMPATGRASNSWRRTWCMSAPRAACACGAIPGRFTWRPKPGVSSLS